ncbi:MAG: OmpA family protein [Vicinamibacterales bacterium]
MSKLRCTLPLTLAVLVVCGHYVAARMERPQAARPTATPAAVPNLLSFKSGAIVRSYTPAIQNVQDIADHGGNLTEGTKGPIQVVYELPGVATLSRIAVSLNPADAGTTAASATVAVSTTSATEGFRDIGTVHSTDESGDPQDVSGASGVRARWVRVTATVPTGEMPIAQVVANGTLAPRPAAAPGVDGDYWVMEGQLNDGGGVRSKPADDSPARLEVTHIADGVNGLECLEDRFSTALPGKLEGRTWTYVATYAGNDLHGQLVLNDEGTILAGERDGEMQVFLRTASGAPAAWPFCKATTLGSGPRAVLVLNGTDWSASYPFGDAEQAASLKGFAFTVVGAPLLTPALLAGKDTVVLNGLCRPQFMLNPQQTHALLDWVQAGHKLLVQDSDECGGDPEHATHYDFMPYPFLTDNPGAKGERGHHLIVVERNSLGSDDKGDAEHFIDTTSYLANPNNDLGDANTVISQDPHWCGQLFGTNADAKNGFEEMYAIYGKGLIVYEGLDHDDASIATHEMIRRLEYMQPVPADLPCSRSVGAGFVILPDQTVTFTPGKAQSFNVPLSVFSNGAWQGHVALGTSGDFPGTLSVSAVDVPPAEGHVSLTIQVPATAKAGHYSVIVKGTAGTNQAHATVSLASAETKDALSSELARNCTVALYGINFDFNQATIRKDAEPVLRQILGLFTADASLAVEIGGHTDNVGAAAYNMDLSTRRAQAVKAWLVAHGVGASRLMAKGYGDTVPLVPNDSDANRFKNRRVELKRPDCAK